MYKKNLFFIAILFCLSFSATAQEEKWSPDPTYSDNIRHREVLMNLTPLVSQFVPFNASTISKFNVFDFETRRFKNGRGTRFSLGVNINSDFNTTEPNSLYLRFGLIKKRQIAERFHFFRSWDINVVAEDTDFSGRAIGKLGFTGLAVSYSAGLQYEFNKRIAISTEGILFLGLLDVNTGGAKIKFIPPVGLFLHVKL